MSKSEQSKSAPFGAGFSPEAIIAFNASVIEAYARAWRAYLQASTRFGQEFTSFVTERMRKDTELGQDLSKCRTWTEAADVQSRWMHSTADDYAHETEKVMEIVSAAAQENGSGEESRTHTKPRRETATSRSASTAQTG